MPFIKLVYKVHVATAESGIAFNERGSWIYKVSPLKSMTVMDNDKAIEEGQRAKT